MDEAIKKAFELFVQNARDGVMETLNNDNMKITLGCQACDATTEVIGSLEDVLFKKKQFKNWSAENHIQTLCDHKLWKIKSVKPKNATRSDPPRSGNT